MGVKDSAPYGVEGDLAVWWVPQVPMKAFWVRVDSIPQAVFLLETLAKYDLFQLENRVKGDFSNAGGLCIFEGGVWVEWCCIESGKDINDVMRDPDPPETAVQALRAIVRQVDAGGEDGKVFARDACIGAARKIVEGRA